MIARYAGATLGLFAFSIVIIAGIFTHNPITVTLSRSIFALFLFCLIGFVLGGAAQLVINEYHEERETQIRKRYKKISDVKEDADSGTDAQVSDTEPVST